MNRRMFGVIGGAATFTLLATAALPGAAQAAPAADPETSQNRAAAQRPDDRPNKLEDKRREMKERAVQLVLSGDRKVQKRGGSRSVRVAPGQ